MRTSELKQFTTHRITAPVIVLGFLLAALAGIASYGRSGDDEAPPSVQPSGASFTQATGLIEAKLGQLEAAEESFGHSVRAAAFAQRFDAKQAQLDAASARMSGSVVPSGATRFIESKLDRLESGR